MLTADDFLKEIEAFLERSGMSATAFGRSAVNDPKFVFDLRNGRNANLGLVERVDAFIKAQEKPDQNVSRETSGASC